MSVLEFLVGKSTFSDFVTTMFYTLGAAAFLVFVFVGVIAFLPAIIALVKNIKIKGFIIFSNIVLPFLFFVYSALPMICWCILVIVALGSKRKMKERELPNITLNILDDGE